MQVCLVETSFFIIMSFCFYLLLTHALSTQVASSFPTPVKIVGMGSAGVDYLAQVAAFPQPDEKLRTERLEVQGGGNCGNALTAAARLGLSPFIVTKIGDDALGDAIVAEFAREGISTQGILRAGGSPSPFTYIIVDRTGCTRTCIHTPGAPFETSEMSPQLADAALQEAELVYFDGRLAEAAVVLARRAASLGVPILVEAERLRPGLDELLQEADFVVTSTHFPTDWTGESCLGDALVTTLTKLPKARWMITTLGKDGSVLLERSEPQGSSVVADDAIAQLAVEARSPAGGGGEPGCVSANGVEILTGGVASVPTAATLRKKLSSRSSAAAAAAAARAATANADRDNPVRYMSDASTTADSMHEYVDAIVTVAEAARLPAAAVLDTTGAGDAFIGSVLYCVATGLSPKHALRLGAVVAACKCTALGARPGLPHRAEISPGLL